VLGAVPAAPRYASNFAVTMPPVNTFPRECSQLFVSTGINEQLQICRHPHARDWPGDIDNVHIGQVEQSVDTHPVARWAPRCSDVAAIVEVASTVFGRIRS
jgi:hypothetical protein